MPLRSNHLRTHALLFAALAASSAEVARAEDLFGRTGTYDLTGSPLIRDLKLDPTFIRGQEPTFAENLGLAGAPTVEVRRNYVYVHDTDGRLPIPYTSQNDLIVSFNFALREAYRVLPDEFVFVYLFTSFETGVGAFFYAPEANSTGGIGYQLFDSNGESPREGFVFMNYWQLIQFGGPPGFDEGQAQSIFNQEAGHRWGSFVTLGLEPDGSGPDVLLGRDNGHWSYFLQTGGSPMEGNNWREVRNGVFETATGWENWKFSPLDLYLMGLVPPSEVPPFFVIAEPDAEGLLDMAGDALNKSSPPQVIRPVTLRGTKHEIKVEQVIARNGPRVPGMEQAPKKFRVLFVMLASQEAPLGEPDRVRFERMVDDYVEGFEVATGRRADLDPVLDVTPKKPIGAQCADIDECDLGESNICLIAATVPTGTGLCTRGCASREACPESWCCQGAGSGSVCLPPTMCEQLEPETPAGAEVCACDTSSSCETGCACDPACAPSAAEACACDRTYDCDRADGSDEGPLCTCDPECVGLTQAELDDEGCGCTSTGPRAGRASALFGIALLGLGCLRAARRRRG